MGCKPSVSPGIAPTGNFHAMFGMDACIDGHIKKRANSGRRHKFFNSLIFIFILASWLGEMNGRRHIERCFTQ